MNYIIENTFNSIAAESFLLIVILGFILYGVVNSTSLVENRLIIINNMNMLTIYSLIISIAIIYFNPFLNIVTFNNSFINDTFISIIKILLLISAIYSIMMSLSYLNDKKIISFEYTILILFSIIAMLLLVSAYNLISIYLAIELQSLSFYILASMKRNSEYSTEASFKYFILGVFSSGFLLLGFSILYGITGINNIEQFYKLFVDNFSYVEHIGIYLGLLLIIMSFLFKIGAVPFHVWLPDVYEGSPLSVTAFFAIMPKIIIISIMLRIFASTFYDLMNELNIFFIMSSIASMILASITALYQNKIIRLLAYSAIGHIGYILIGFASASIESIQSLLLYIIVYIIMTINLYSSVIALKSKDATVEIKYLKEFTNLSKINPVLAFTIITILFSMAGIPPLAGFFSKLYIFFSAINGEMYLLALIGVLTSVISAVYYIYLIRIMYFDKSDIWMYTRQINKELSIILAMSFFFIVSLFIFSSPILMFTHKLALLLTV